MVAHSRCTGAGSDRSVSVPSPSWPEALLPQHQTLSFCPTAHPEAEPMDTERTGEMPGTETGAVREIIDPSPSCPDPFAPQQRTPREPVTAQVLPPPADNSRAPDPSPTTSTGFGVSIAVSLPRAPEELRPQQRTSPPTRSTQVCEEPADRTIAALGIGTWMGKPELGLPAAPGPSCP